MTIKYLNLTQCGLPVGATTKTVQSGGWDSPTVEIDPLYLLARIIRESTDTFVSIVVDNYGVGYSKDLIPPSKVVMDRLRKEYDMEKAVVYESPKLIENPVHAGHPRMRFIVLKGLGEKHEV